MAIKLVLKSLDEVAEGLRGEYKVGSDGRYYADVEALDEHPDVGALKRAKDREVKSRQAAETRVKELEGRVEELETADTERLKGMVKKEDADALEKKYKVASEKQIADLTSALALRDESIQELTVESEALRLAQSLAVDEKTIPVFLPHIQKRLTVSWEEVDGKRKPIAKVLGDDGKPSSLTIEQLRAEFVANPGFAPIIKGSDASGGGALGGSGSGGADSQKNADKATIAPKDLAAIIQRKRKIGGKS